MKATGIVRRIDDLGRIVIPKEIRRTMRIRDGDPLEIFIGNGEIVFKKYSLIGELENFAFGFAETLHKYLNLPVAICDLDHVVAAGGIPRKDIENTQNSRAFITILSKRETYMAESGKTLAPVDGVEKNALIIVPIISGGDLLGGIVVFEGNERKTLTEADIKLTRLTAGLLATQTQVE